MRNILLCTFLILQFVNGFNIFSQEIKIIDIEINGLKKTKENTVLNIIDLEDEALVDYSISDIVKQKLLSSGIFQNDIQVIIEVISDNKAKLIITLKERWTFIPIPVVVINSESWLAGGVLIESNLLGLNQTLVAGTFFSDEGVQGFSAWSNPSLFKSDYALGLTTSFNSGTTIFLDITGETELSTFDENRLLVSVNLGKNMWDTFSWKIATGVEWFQVDESDIEQFILNNVLTLKWEDLYYKDFFNQGWSNSISSTLLSTTGDFINPLFELSISKSLIINKRNRLKFHINAGWQDSLEYKPLLIGGTEGSRVLPSGAIAAKLFGDSLISFEPIIKKIPGGIITLPIYYESGLYQSLENEYNYWHGPGIGFRFYVDKVAIPALGADFTWDFYNQLFNVSVSIGGSGGGN